MTARLPAPALELRDFMVKERVGVLKMTDAFDIFDPQTQKQVAFARETPSGFILFARFFISKTVLANTVTVTEGEQAGSRVLFRIHKSAALFRSKVTVRDETGRELGYFKNKILSFGGGFWVYDTRDKQVAEVKGDWKGWNFKFLGSNGQEMGEITKKWAGLAKEFFTSADTYRVTIDHSVAESADTRILLLAAALSIDIIFKERG